MAYEVTLWGEMQPKRGQPLFLRRERAVCTVELTSGGGCDMKECFFVFLNREEEVVEDDEDDDDDHDDEEGRK